MLHNVRRKPKLYLFEFEFSRLSILTCHEQIVAHTNRTNIYPHNTHTQLFGRQMQATTHLLHTHTHTSADILLQCKFVVSCRPSLKCKYAMRRAAETAVWMLCTPDSHLAARARTHTYARIYYFPGRFWRYRVCVCAVVNGQVIFIALVDRVVKKYYFKTVGIIIEHETQPIICHPMQTTSR